MATSKQNPVIREILRQGQKLPARVRARYIAAALETGKVESNYQNLPGGDADSQGWRQERASLYKDPQNLKASVARFYQESAQLDRGQPSYELAADVQRPAAQYRGRYRDVHGEAMGLLKGSGGAAVPSPAKPSTPTQGLPAYQTTSTPGVNNAGLRQQAALSYLQQGGVNNQAATMALASQYQALKDVPGVTTRTKVQAPTPSHSPSSRGRGSAFSGTAPVAKLGNIIGTPYAGTHTLGNWQSDNAVDIAVPVGTPMVALQDGVIVKVRKHPQGAGRFAGDQITVRGANGNEYFYAHGLATVKPGQKVRKGQELGTTGSANGVAHLHFGQMKGDPRQHTRG